MAKAISRLHKKEHRRVKKALSNKWVRAAVIVAAVVFTAGWAAAAMGAAGGATGLGAIMKAGVSTLATSKGMAAMGMLATAGGAIAKAEAQSKMFDRMVAAEEAERHRRESNTNLKDILIKDPYKALLSPILPVPSLPGPMSLRRQAGARQGVALESGQQPEQFLPIRRSMGEEQPPPAPVAPARQADDAGAMPPENYEIQAGYVPSAAPYTRQAPVASVQEPVASGQEKPSLARRYGLTLREIMEGARWQG